jgi:hypothetical protein
MKNAAEAASGDDAHHLILLEPAGRADESRSPISSRRRSGPALAQRTVSLGLVQAGRYAEYDLLLLCVNNVW